MQYSPSANQFFDGAPMPSDVVAVTSAQIQAALFCVNTGGVMTADSTGKPSLTYAPGALAASMEVQFGLLQASYLAAIVLPVWFKTAAGVVQSYQADPGSVSNLQASLIGCAQALATPAGFYWVANDNTQVPFTYPDLQGLAAAIFAQGATAFQRLQVAKSAVRAATTIAAVQAVVF